MKLLTTSCSTVGLSLLQSSKSGKESSTEVSSEASCGTIAGAARDPHLQKFEGHTFKYATESIKSL